MLAIVQSPLGLGQVSTDSMRAKSARLKTNILVSSATTHRSGFILMVLTSDLQLVSMMHFSWAKLWMKLTVVPDHDFVFGVPWSFASTDQGEDIGFVDNLNDTDPSSELSREGFGDIFAQFVDSEPFLSADAEIGLVLVESDME